MGHIKLNPDQKPRTISISCRISDDNKKKLELIAKLLSTETKENPTLSDAIDYVISNSILPSPF